MRVTVKKWRNSATVRIPAAIMEAVHLHLDDIVDVREEGGCIVIEPVQSKAYDLTQLVAEITPKNQHSAVNFGPAVGRESR